MHKAIPTGTSRLHGLAPETSEEELVDQIESTLEDPTELGPETLLDMPLPTATVAIGNRGVSVASEGSTVYLRAPMAEVLPFFGREADDLDVFEVMYKNEIWTMVKPRGATS